MAPTKDLNLKVEYVTRVEGHGNIVANVKNGKVEKCDFHVVETPRLFEGMLRGRSIFEAQAQLKGDVSGGYGLGLHGTGPGGGKPVLYFHPGPAFAAATRLSVTVSMGIAVFPEDGNDGSTLLQRADTALYRSKKDGRNTVR